MRTTRLLVMTVALLAVAMPASAAVTLRGLFLDGTPRAAWLERYSEARQGPEQVDTIQQTYKVGDGAVLDLSQISGDIRVTGGSGSEVRIEATKRVRHRDPAEARRLLNELRVDVNNFNDRIEVRTLYPRRGGRGNNISASVDYVIAVPSSASVALRAISGDVTVMQVAGEVRAETVSGDVHVTATPNLAVAKTISGDVIARDIGTRLSLVLSTVSGTVSASGLKARTLEAASVSGDVRLAATEVERVEANSVSGNIEFDAPLVKGGRYQFTSHSGNVRVLLSNSTGFELDADTFAGSVRSDVPVTLRSMGRTERDRRGSSRAIRGTYGDASALLIVRSHSGSVVITKK